MFNIMTLNKIAAVGTDRFGGNYAVADNHDNPDAIMVRSASMHDMEFGSNLLAIARAGAGVNNIPLDKCAEQGICVFNTPGANANAVKELVLCGMLLASRDVVGGISWVKSAKDDADIAKSVEKEKSKFAGTELKGKTIGIIGLGAIGALVANAAVSLGMNVIGYDPFLSVNGALSISRAVKYVTSTADIYAAADFISVHVPCNDNTKGMINKEAFALMKDGVIILNYARDALINDDDMKEAIASGKVRKYVTDFPNPKTANMEGVIAIPHLGASTEESEDNCAVMAADELVAYLESGNIINSVNFPNAEMNAAGKKVCVMHKNVPAIISSITTLFGGAGVNIDNMLNKSRGDYAYTMLDVANADDAIVAKISEIEGVIRVRVI
ncbi:MAG: phosphoglycerate dehydrogenase [Oscillospiraceae bacterium]|nr:phosphoglycerate dehydrogenase [Oscillospiraceae bacterium]